RVARMARGRRIQSLPAAAPSRRLGQRRARFRGRRRHSRIPVRLRHHAFSRAGSHAPALRRGPLVGREKSLMSHRILILAWAGLSGLLGLAPARINAAEFVSSAAVSGAARIVSFAQSGRIYLWDGYGSLRARWPVAASGAWPAGTPRLQDLDGDGQPEVVCLMKSWDGGRSIRAWRLDGQPWAG